MKRACVGCYENTPAATSNYYSASMLLPLLPLPLLQHRRQTNKTIPIRRHIPQTHTHTQACAARANITLSLYARMDNTPGGETIKAVVRIRRLCPSKRIKNIKRALLMNHKFGYNNEMRSKSVGYSKFHSSM